MWNKSQLILDLLMVKTFTKFPNETRSKEIINRYSISTFLCLMLYSLRILNQPWFIIYFPALQYARTLKLSVSVHKSEEIINFENKPFDHLFCSLNQITTNQKTHMKPHKTMRELRVFSGGHNFSFSWSYRMLLIFNQLRDTGRNPLFHA